MHCEKGWWAVKQKLIITTRSPTKVYTYSAHLKELPNCIDSMYLVIKQDLTIIKFWNHERHSFLQTYLHPWQQLPWVPRLLGMCKFLKLYLKESILEGTLYYSGTWAFKLLTRALIYQYGDMIIYIYILDRELPQCRLLK